ncbi:MAG: hypothetical protein ACLUA4_00885 [Bifidobacterium sp.]
MRFLAEAIGKGTLTLFRSTARGLSSPVQTFTIGSIDSKTAERIEATLTLKGMLDGGYYWFDARAAKDAALTVSMPNGKCQPPTDAPSTPDVCPSPLPHLTRPSCAWIGSDHRQRAGTARTTRHRLLHRSRHKSCARPSGL